MRSPPTLPPPQNLKRAPSLQMAVKEFLKPTSKHGDIDHLNLFIVIFYQP